MEHPSNTPNPDFTSIEAYEDEAINEDAWDILSTTCEGLPDQHVDRIASLYEQHGAKFAAYLALPGTDPREDDIEEHFTSQYCTSGPAHGRLEHVVAEQSGWVDELREAVEATSIPPQLVTFNYPYLARLLSGHFETVELDGWRHLFLAPPSDSP